MVLLVFELEATNDNGDRYLLQKRYNKSLHPKSNLRQDLERWRTKPFTDEDLHYGFNLEKVIGITAMVYVEYKDTDRGKWANVDSILPAPELQLQPSGSYQRVTESLQES
ncbi:phage replication initiation protein, NGO0469 family [Rhodohalobacter sp.]|uniref:phage replication initiation protein, NGO0469 family n=1 Tax=Rhodohalobacter sp. TaxID=1974210 RepID=UPI002ACEE6A9|nr:hypothetical protein [Rhodohalobacter sp.]MDZ7757224.1 hypothetical protein [Rhodohalobacter sp.]